MTKAPKTKAEAPEGDPKEGDAILKRMLQMKPKPHAEMKIKEKRITSEARKGRADRGKNAK
jgi:hypothetical protein